MDQIINFVTDFPFFEFKLGVGESLLVPVIAVLILITVNWVLSLFDTNTAGRVRKIFTFIFYFLYYGSCIVLVLKGILLKETGKASVFVFALLLPKLKDWLAVLYEKYDALVDSKIADGDEEKE